MNKKLTVIGLLLLAMIGFVLGMNAYQKRVLTAQTAKVQALQERLVRPHSPTFGKETAPVTIVEFFDPACETCRAFYPVVKRILDANPDNVRLVLRYAPFHAGSDFVVRILEAAKRQGIYWPVVEAVLRDQPSWASHDKPDLGAALASAVRAGLDPARAKAALGDAALTQLMQQDVQDLMALEVTKTPTFFVNGRPLLSFGEKPLIDLVNEELARIKR